MPFKKSYYDIMTFEEMWQWADGPLTAAFFPDPTQDMPQPLLGSNYLIGSMQVRQARVRSTECGDLELIQKVSGSGHKCFPRWSQHFMDLQPYGGPAGLDYKAKEFESNVKGSSHLRMSADADPGFENYGDVGFYM